MKKSILVLAVAILSTASFAQKKRTTTSATINFDATTSLDALPKASNKTAVASLNTKTGDVAFEAIIKNFAFSNPKIQEHFNNATWMDSDKFPKATFKGKIVNLSAVNFKADGTYTANVEGELTMHGVTQKVTTVATIVVKGKTITTNSDFSVKVADYGVNGPAIGAGKVATDPKISVMAEFK
jgi:polyisoprenoid-binding protein YceI